MSRIVHFKCSGTDNWGKARARLEMIAQAKARGLDVDCDLSYAAGSNPLKNLDAAMGAAGGVEAMLERLKLAETRRAIRTDIARDGLTMGPYFRPGIACRSRSRRICRSFAGRTIGALAHERGQDTDRYRCRYLWRQSRDRVLVTSISEDDIREIVPPRWRSSAPTAIASPITARFKPGCRIRASTARFRASSATTSASSAPSRWTSPCTR